MKTGLYLIAVLLCCFLSGCHNTWMEDILKPLSEGKGKSSSYPEIPSNYLTIGSDGVLTAYTGPTPLGNVAIPAQVDGITVTGIKDFFSPYGVFENKGLTGVTIPNGVTYIGQCAFYDNPLTSVIIPNSVTEIGFSAFQDNQLTSVTIPSSVSIIQDNSFNGNQLTSITISNGVQTISGYAFYDNQLTSITIPDSVYLIVYGAFAGNQLTSVTFEGYDAAFNFPISFTDNTGDLGTKYLAGGPGTYTRPNVGSTTWTKQ